MSLVRSLHRLKKKMEDPFKLDRKIIISRIKFPHRNVKAGSIAVNSLDQIILNNGYMGCNIHKEKIYVISAENKYLFSFKPFPKEVVRGRNIKITTNSQNQIIVLLVDIKLIRVFSDRGLHLFDFGSQGEGRLDHPRGIVVNSHDDIIVADKGKIKMFSSDGDFLRDFNLRMTYIPSAIAVNSKDEIIIALSYKIYTYSLDGKLIRSFGTLGKGDGQLTRDITNIAVNSRDEIIVIDSGPNKIDPLIYFPEFDRGPGMDPSNFRDIDLELMRHRAQIFSPDGDYIYTFGSRYAMSKNYIDAHDVAVNSHDEIFISNYEYNEIFVYRDVRNNELIEEEQIPTIIPQAEPTVEIIVHGASGESQEYSVSSNITIDELSKRMKQFSPGSQIIIKK